MQEYVKKRGGDKLPSSLGNKDYCKRWISPLRVWLRALIQHGCFSTYRDNVYFWQNSSSAP